MIWELGDGKCERNWVKITYLRLEIEKRVDLQRTQKRNRQEIFDREEGTKGRGIGLDWSPFGLVFEFGVKNWSKRKWKKKWNEDLLFNESDYNAFTNNN